MLKSSMVFVFVRALAMGSMGSDRGTLLGSGRRILSVKKRLGAYAIVGKHRTPRRESMRFSLRETFTSSGAPEVPMPIHALKGVQTKIQNGVGAFVQPCKKITLRYCNWGGSSRGMRQLVREELREIAANYPRVEIAVQTKSGHPIVQGEYAGGLTKTVCVRNYDPLKIKEKIQLVSDSSGSKLRKFQRSVESTNPSVRGIWSPFHVDKESRLRV